MSSGLHVASSPTFTAGARRLGIVSAGATVLLTVVYAIPLVGGLLSLPSPDAPIGDPWFSMMEMLIILTMPFMVGLMVAVHAWASADTRALALLGVIFTGLLTVVTCSVHFVILTVIHRPEFVGQSWLPLVLSFRWISVTYALDILAWDVFFALAVLCAAPVFRGSRLTRWIRILLLVSGALSLGGLSGVFLDDATFRGIGIVGYAAVFPVAALLLGLLFYRSAPANAVPGGTSHFLGVRAFFTSSATQAATTPNTRPLATETSSMLTAPGHVWNSADSGVSSSVPGVTNGISFSTAGTSSPTTTAGTVITNPIRNPTQKGRRRGRLMAPPVLAVGTDIPTPRWRRAHASPQRHFSPH
jgi:hypothetical protein